MALILSLPMSGSIGSETHSRGRSGQVVRQRAIPTNPNTAAQINARARLTTMSAAWRGLTDAQRASWNGFASSFTVTNSLGSSIQLTGHQCFVKVNTVNGQIGDAMVNVPPALPAFIGATVTALAATAGTPLVELTGVTPAGGTKFMVFASAQRSAGVTFENDLRYIATFTTATANKFTITTPYTAKFGSLVAGKKIFVQVVQSQAGMQDNGTLFTAIVGA